MRQRSRAWQRGYEDAKAGRSDFQRRAFSGTARLDYMDGRLAWSSRKLYACDDPERDWIKDQEAACREA